jgi:two-component system CitB family sensor kinase
VCKFVRRRRQLSNRILASVVGILVATTLVGFVLVTLEERTTLEHQYQRRALGIAQAFAAVPSVRAALAHPGAANRNLVAALAEQVRAATHASYVVVIDRHGIRWSHPDRRLIGRRVTEPVVALDGRDHLGVDHGNLGTSANAKVPLRAPDGRVVGEVSAGILERQIFDQLRHELPVLLLFFAVALGIGVIASLTLARRLKRSTFGLELEEIAALVQEREAMLHGIREGVITLDPQGRVTLINDEARRLVPLGVTAVGARLEELLPDGRLRQLLSGVRAERDAVVVTDEHILVINHTPVSWRNRELGAVVTIRDRTELEALLRELDSVDSLTDALRAQQHEFSNRMHTVAGLVELGDHDAAIRFALDTSSRGAGLAEAIREHVERPEIAAMLLAKTTVAAERGVTLTLAGASRLADPGEDTRTVLTVAGNLIDNAIDAAAASGPPREVEVLLSSEEPEAIRIEVADTGPGVPDELVEQIFTDGFTTKAPDDRSHGIGLALVHRLVHRAGGRIAVTRDDRTRFTVTLPATAPREVEAVR